MRDVWRAWYEAGVIEFPDTVPQAAEGAVVAIGNFDGVHAGHKHLLAQARAKAEALGLPLVVLTFEPHPRSVLFPDVPLHRLSTADEKLALLKAAGADAVAVVPFDLTVATWTPDDFVQRVLVDWLRARAVVVGANFRYGHKAAGDTASLAADGRFEVVVVDLLEDDGGVISSRRLRGEG
ncbi:MAG: adenylyltransferase/cytidyltransferase family protein [Pseudomonadaceae bacterium]|nr:adenylyltransferase/cytidyltransferase family protein [Pseudomonadaceae bacterium]